jgi:TfoX/Sxy family transcriptional regulator of competence genes
MMTLSRRRSHGKFVSFQRLFGKYELYCKKASFSIYRVS